MAINIRLVTTGDDVKYHSKLYRELLRTVEKFFQKNGNGRKVFDSEKKRTRSGNGFRQYIIVN